MQGTNEQWVVVLAGGDGRRLQVLTTTKSGMAIPKQFCTLDGGRSLLEDALCRAELLVARDKILVVVAAHHRRWWAGALAGIPAENIIVQPRNRGTALGILLAAIHIVARDPDARLIVLPSDHHVQDEMLLARYIRFAAKRREKAWGEILLMGFTPREPDPELGYIVPGSRRHMGQRDVERFVEKPPERLARELLEEGALWNAFILVADGAALLKLFERRCPEIVSALREIFLAAASGARRVAALEQLYAELPCLDFSRQILEGQEQYLQVQAVPECGWSDLGTPQRVAAALGARQGVGAATQSRKNRVGLLSLAAQHRRLYASAAADHLKTGTVA